ncbi:MAG TPA: 2-C-methyl-D-erythritol 4-phosphate cytidylyltransferase [Burkholderiales bacterium]|nr:2-C-methyl-D-erythritol 4-phosphate cytidylyltransferase [Burkholderiales bacterium]
MSKYFALIPAAGTGSRMGNAMPKQYQPINGRPMLWHALFPFNLHPRIERMFVVLSPTDAWFAQMRWDEFKSKLEVLRCGGESRAQSVLNGLQVMAGGLVQDDQVLVHDAARPCLTRHAIDQLMSQVADNEAGGLLAEPLADTLKRADESGHVLRTEPRERLWRAQTPQMFRYDVLVRALSAGTLEDLTDEASAVERLGLSPFLVKSDATNLKVTYAEDLHLAEAILNNRAS